MTKKTASLLLALAAVAGLASCGRAAEPSTSSQNSESSPVAEKGITSPLTADDLDIYTPQQKPDENGYYTSFICETPQMSVTFEGRELASASPTIFLEDLTGDGFPDPACVLVNSSGTGVSVEEIHVFDGRTLEKLVVEDIGKTISMYVKKSSDDSSYTLEVCGETYTIDKSSLITEPSHLFTVPELGAVVKYSVRDNKIICELNCKCGMNESCGWVTATLKYDGGSFVLDTATFSERLEDE